MKSRSELSILLGIHKNLSENGNKKDRERKDYETLSIKYFAYQHISKIKV